MHLKTGIMNLRIISSIIVLTFIGGYSCSSKSGPAVIPSSMQQEKQTFTFDNAELIEEYTDLGELSLENANYNVYNCFRKIKVANGYRGQSVMLFLSSSDTVAYLLDSQEDFPDSLVAHSIYSNGEPTSITELSNPLCLQNGCFDQDVSLISMLRGIDSLVR